MTDKEVQTYGVFKQKTLNDHIDEHIEEIDRIGFTVMDSGLPAEFIENMRISVDKIYATQVNEQGLDLLVRSNDIDIARAPLTYDDNFLELAIFPPLVELCKRIFGENFVLLQQNAIINRPLANQYQKRWHRDLAYQHFTLDGTNKLAINALFCLDSFKSDTGGTWILPGSHKFTDFPSDKFTLKHQVSCNVSAGSILILDAMLYHRSGFNTSNIVRRGVNHLIGLPLLVPQIDFPKALKKGLKEDPFLSKYLGYRWNPKLNSTEWRKERNNQ